jgi:hypothetical protein
MKRAERTGKTSRETCGEIAKVYLVVIARSEATKQSILPLPTSGLLRFARDEVEDVQFMNSPTRQLSTLSLGKIGQLHSYSQPSYRTLFLGFHAIPKQEIPPYFANRPPP